MLRRFVSAAGVAAVFMVLAALAIVLLPPARLNNLHPLLIAWLCAPALWGIWALLAPSSWVPERLPSWGAVLGVVAGTFGLVIMNAPLRAFDVSLPVRSRVVAMLLVVALYYIGWMVVRAVLVRLLEPPTHAAPQRDRAHAA